MKSLPDVLATVLLNDFRGLYLQVSGGYTVYLYSDATDILTF